jgi:hypothetical protein
MPGPRRSEMLEKYGHAGGHLREALMDALDHRDEWWQHVEIDFNHERHNRWWSRLSARSRARWLLGQLWNCQDMVPSLVRSEFDQDVGTFGRLARLLAEDLKPDKEAAAAA